MLIWPGTKRSRLAAVVAATMLVVSVPWGLAGVAQARVAHRRRLHTATPRHRSHRLHRRAVYAGTTGAVTPLAFNLRLSPTFDVGQAGWNVVVEENGAFEGSTGIGVIHPSTPFVSVSGHYTKGAHESTMIAVTLPEVTAVLVEGNMRVATEALPGLPFGLRAARVTTPYEESLSREGSLASNPPPIIKPMVALGGNGEPILRATSRETQETPFQGTVHKWSYPSGPPQGSCELHAGGEAGLTAESGAILSDIRPYPGHIFADAFLPCSSTLYSLDGHQLRAYVLLDAANPGKLPAVIPGLAPVPGAPGIYSGNSGFYGGPTALTARRSGDAWLAVDGAGSPERMQLLEDLSATIEL